MQLFLKLTLISLFSSSLFCHRTDILISPPRHLSTAFLRMMDARKEYIILNEPFISTFSFKSYDSTQLTQNWWLPNSPTTYQEAENRVLSYMAQGPVFIKEMTFAFDKYLSTPNPFIGNSDVHFIFLVRNPHHMLCSYYKGLGIFGSLADEFEYWATYQHLYELYNYVKMHHCNPPILIRSEDFYNNTEQTARKICSLLEIPFMEQMLHWNTITNELDIASQWHDLKQPGPISHWHGDALLSTHISKPRSYEVDGNGVPTFTEITNPVDRERVKKVYEKNLIYYQLLLDEIAN